MIDLPVLLVPHSEATQNFPIEHCLNLLPQRYRRPRLSDERGISIVPSMPAPPWRLVHGSARKTYTCDGMHLASMRHGYDGRKSSVVQCPAGHRRLAPVFTPTYCNIHRPAYFTHPGHRQHRRHPLRRTPRSFLARRTLELQRRAVIVRSQASARLRPTSDVTARFLRSIGAKCPGREDGLQGDALPSCHLSHTACRAASSTKASMANVRVSTIRRADSLAVFGCACAKQPAAVHSRHRTRPQLSGDRSSDTSV